MKGTILVLDFGTSALKAVLYNDKFQIAAKRSVEFCYLYPETHRIEFDAQKYYGLALCLMKELVMETGSEDTLDVVSVTGQAETLICLDRDGNPLGNAIVWLDTRAQDECSRLGGSIEKDDFYNTTGLVDLDPVMPLCKTLWIKNNEPDRFSDTDKFLLLKDYIIYYLTGIFATDYSVSSCTGYFNITAKKWEQYLLELAGIDESRLPCPMSPQAVIGNLLPGISGSIGCGRQVKVVNGMLDQCASAIGSGNFSEGIITETTGSVLAVAATLTSFSAGKFACKMPVMCHGFSDKYLALPNCPTGGILLKWYKDNFLEAEQEKMKQEGTDIYQFIDKCIMEKTRKKNNIIFLPHFCGYTSPVSNPDAKGVLYGLTMDSDRFDVALSILEGVSFLLKENIDLLRRNGISASDLISMGGGARSPLWLQIKANVTHMVIRTLINEESTSLGCAVGAAIATGKFTDRKEILKYIKPRDSYYPNESEFSYFDDKYEQYNKLNMQLGFVSEPV